ncbi:MAG TPA: DcaP family trimeric outer membrane transporter [Gammaproteobacteria bacterium]|nr:DcaP family trimeric outer membrane transporter [Gammaproteobacteria bacterium]
MRRRALPAALLAAVPFSANAADTEVNVSGFIKFDALATQYSDGAQSSSLMNEFFVPSLIPTGGNDAQTRYNAHARESRIRFTTDTEIDDHQLGTHLELDFQVTDVDGSDERISNSNAPRVRHAFFTFDNWLFGQTWSTFYNVSSLPELNDFVGPVGTLFNRQPQLRYSAEAGYGTWHFAVENPETRVLNDENLDPDRDDNGDQDAFTANAGGAPDVALRYDYATDHGSNVSLAVLGRQLAYEHADDAATEAGELETAYGGGVSLSGRLKVGSLDDFRFMANYGQLGRYLGLNAFPGAYIADNGDLEPITTAGGFVAYRHFWNNNLRSTVSVSMAQADVARSEVGGGEADRYTSSHVNLMYSPIDPATFGIEYTWAERENVDDTQGRMQRVQFSAKYAF